MTTGKLASSEKQTVSCRATEMLLPGINTSPAEGYPNHCFSLPQRQTCQAGEGLKPMTQHFVRVFLPRSSGIIEIIKSFNMTGGNPAEFLMPKISPALIRGSRMKRVEQLFREANQLLDASEFEAAIEVYQEAALLEKPQGGVLPNLRIAWMLSHSKFLDQLIEKFPDSIAAYIQKIDLDLINNRSREVIVLCGNLLEKFGKDENINVRLRSLRFRAAIQSGLESHLVEDFVAVWVSLQSSSGKRALLRDLLSATDTQLMSIFLQLAEITDFPQNVKLLFQRKAELLQMLDKVYITEIQD